MSDKTGIKEATGTLVPVDATVFIESVKYFSEQALFEEFSTYLKENGVNELIMDVNFANHIKQFLAKNTDTKTDPKAAVIIACDCSGGGGGGGGGGGRMNPRMDPLGVRG